MGYTPYTPNIQIKHWKSFALLGSANHFALCAFWDVCIPHKLSDKNFLDHISHAILYLNVKKKKKNSIFKADCDKQRKVDTVQYVEQKSSWDKWNEPPPTTQRLVFIQRRWCCACSGIGRESSIMTSLWKTKQSQQVLLPIKSTESSIWQKHPELVNRKHIIFHQDKYTRLHISLMTGKNCYSLAGKSYFICHIHQTLHLWVSTYFSLYKFLLMGGKKSIPWKTIKGT